MKSQTELYHSSMIVQEMVREYLFIRLEAKIEHVLLLLYSLLKSKL